MARRSLIVALGDSALAVLPSGAAAATRARRRAGLTSAPTRPWSASLDAGRTGSTDAVRLPQDRPAPRRPRRRPIVTGLANTVNTDAGFGQRGGLVLLHSASGTAWSRRHSPGLTVLVDTHRPGRDRRRPGRVRAGTVSGTVDVTGTSTDAASGVARASFTSARPEPAPRARSSAPPGIRPASPTAPTTSATSSTDNAGHVAVAKITVTVANAEPPAVWSPPWRTPPPRPAPVAGTVISDKLAPGAPTKLSLVLPRSKIRAEKVARDAALGQAGRGRPRPRRRRAQPQARAARARRRQHGLQRARRGRPRLRVGSAPATSRCSPTTERQRLATRRASASRLPRWFRCSRSRAPW